MNLNKLFELQRELDERIEQQHPRKKGEDRLAMKILALQVELGELANEWRGFKFWSYDQEPRGYNYYLEGYGIELKNPLLDEYVDCLHFILSIGLEVKIETHEPIKLISLTNDTLGQFNALFGVVANWNETNLLLNPGRFHEFLNNFLHLGELLGFAWRDIEQAYHEKNKVNHERQDSGY